jgi:hypothetical protein
MRKLTIVTVLVFFTSVAAMAQTEQGKFKFSIGLEAGYTAGMNVQRWNFGSGATAQAEYFLKDRISMTVMGGFIGYLGNNADANYKYRSVNIFPVKAGIRFYLGESFHIGGQLGAGFMGIGDSHSTAFAYSPIIGYNFKTNDDRSIDFSIKYDGYSYNQKDLPNTYGSSFAAVGLRVSYVF